MEIRPLTPDLHQQAADLFAANYRRLRHSLPELPAAMEDPAVTEDLLRKIPAAAPGCAAFQEGRLAGYLAGFVFPDMRGTGRMGAFVPEWGHAARENSPRIYRALYRAISRQWTAAGVRMHGIGVLADDDAALQAWFWNGFGVTVVDAIRPIAPTGGQPPAGWQFRQAVEQDFEALSRLDAEHCRHYSQPPVFMAPRAADDVATLRRFAGQPPNSFWLALRNGEPGGFMRFEPRSDGAAEIVVSPQTIAITGAFVRPQFRGEGVATALLDAALRAYAAAGFTRCSVDFESFNPEAAGFWLRYFRPVVLSLIRVPEWIDTESIPAP
jgi:GNAT superfamily N-acetyltransferase